MKIADLICNSNLSYRNNELYFEEINLKKFTSKIKNPCYLYSKKIIEDNLDKFQSAIKKFKINGKMFFATKTNLNRKIITIIKNKDCGIDVTSVGEMEEAMNCQVKGENIVFSGVGKTKEELTFAIKNNVQINTESLNEIILINQISKNNSKITEISIRINPEIDAHTHKKISTGRAGDKFGILLCDLKDFLDEIRNMQNISITGLSFHIGSQITQLEPFTLLFNKINEIYQDYKNIFDIKKIDVGGGIGVAYKNKQKTIQIEEYMKSLYDNLSSKLPPYIKYYFEPGRYIVANSGILISKIIYIKKSGNENFAILNTGMNNLIRPALYGSYHEIIPIIKRNKQEIYNIVGPICESSDVFAKNRKIFSLKESDFLAILTTGAYSQAMASMYNARDIIEEYLIEDNNIIKIRNKVSMKYIATKFYSNL